MRRMAVKFMPEMLSLVQKEIHFGVLEYTNGDRNFYKIMIISNETWWYYNYNQETKA